MLANWVAGSMMRDAIHVTVSTSTAAGISRLARRPQKSARPTFPVRA